MADDDPFRLIASLQSHVLDLEDRFRGQVDRTRQLEERVRQLEGRGVAAPVAIERLAPPAPAPAARPAPPASPHVGAAEAKPVTVPARPRGEPRVKPPKGRAPLPARPAAVAAAPAPVIPPAKGKARVRGRPSPAAPAAPPKKATDPAAPILSAEDAAEREKILAALKATQWNRQAAAEKAGYPRRTFYRRLKALSIQ